jgi:hypothetical protein
MMMMMMVMIMIIIIIIIINLLNYSTMMVSTDAGVRAV